MFYFWRAGRVLHCSSGLPNWRVLVGQLSEDGSLRTQARPSFLGEDMAGTIYTPESRSRASEVRERIRRSFRLDILSLIAPTCRGVDHEAMGVFQQWEL